MRTPLRLGLYGLILLAVFFSAYAAGGALVPEETVRQWGHEAEEGDGHDDHR